MGDLTADIKDLLKFQNDNNKRIAAMKPSGAAGRALQYGLTALHRYAVATTHRDTGTLAASHIMELDLSSLRGRIYINPSARNPKSGQMAAIYGPHEHARGGQHAFYKRTIDEAGPGVVDDMMRMLEAEL